MNRAVFLDRDGTLIEDRDYLHRPEEVVVFPRVGPALKRLQDAGFKLFIVTNQSGVGRGYFPIEDVHRVHEHFARELAKDGVRFEKIYIAPEHPDAPSRGRKPSPQFLFDARDKFGLDLTQSYMIGDKLIDLECGWNAGVKRSILVRTGYGARLERESPDKLLKADVYSDLPHVVRAIFDEDVSQHCARIQAARERKGLTPQQAEQQCGISWDVESDSHELFMGCSLKEISTLCRVLESPPRELFRDHARDLRAPAIGIEELINRIQEYCRLNGTSVQEFENKVGWRLRECFGKPAKALEDWNVDCLRDTCDALGIDWFQVVAGL